MQKEQNERLTQTGPGTPMGEAFRRYWQPFALESELPGPDCPPIRVRLLSEDLIAFRDTEGKVGLVDAFCPHRRAPLFFGRNEECGIRCPYHGWKFDTTGACVDLPSEPPESKLKDKVTITAYPTWEGGGMIWAYLGPPEQQPEPPDYELVRAPATHRGVSKTWEACNYLQALEGGFDTTHSSFVHNQNVASNDMLVTRDKAPKLEIDQTPYGYTYCGIRSISESETLNRSFHYFMPAQSSRGTYLKLNGEPEDMPTVNGHIWVPVDDHTCAVYNWLYSSDPDVPITDEGFEAFESFFGRGKDDFIEGTFWLKKNLSNDYMIDRELQRTTVFTGITGFQTQDYAVQEGMGPIVDRTKETLVKSDRAVIALRRLLLEAADAVEAGQRPKGVDTSTYRDARPIDVILPKGIDWRDGGKDQAQAIW